MCSCLCPQPTAVPGAAERWDGVSLEAWPELVEAAREKLGETLEVRTAALAELRCKLESLPEADRPYCTSDAYLLRFLRARKFRVQEALDVVKAAHKFERENPRWFSNLSGEEFRAVYASGFMRILQGRDRLGRRVSILLPTRMPGPDLMSPDGMMRWNMWALGRMATCPYFCVLGTSIMENFEIFSFKQAMAMNSNMPPSVMKQNFHFIQKCAAYRLGAILVVNQPRFLTWMYALVKPFMSKKMKSRVHLLGSDVSLLAQHMDPTLLPPELGGSSSESPMAWFDEQCALEAQGL